MARLFEYLDKEIFCHHSLDTVPNPKQFYMHVHERMEVFYLISGSVDYIVEGSVYKLNPGNIVITNSGEAHKPDINVSQPYERISIQFDASLLKPLDPDGIFLRPFYDRSLGQHNLYPIAGYPEDLFQPFFSRFDYSGNNTQQRLHIISTLFMVINEISHEFESRDESEKYPHAEGFVHQLINFINANLFENISIFSISQEFYLSESQINRVFKKATGSSVWEYIRIKRLLAAREKILAGESAATASSCCGFQDYSAFYRAYKARFGVAPSKTIPYK